MKNPYDNNGPNSLIVDRIVDGQAVRELYNGETIEGVKISVRVNKECCELYGDYSLLDEGRGLIPLPEIKLCDIHDPLLSYKLAGGYEIGNFDKEEYLDGLVEYMCNLQFQDFTTPILDYIRFPESLHRKRFRDNLTAYIDYLASGGKDRYLTDYHMLTWQNALYKVKGHLSIYNDTLLDKGIVKKKGVMRTWRKETV